MNLTISSSPHVRARESTPIVMRDVLVALLPACLFGIAAFGANTLLLFAVAIVSAVLTEYWIQRLTHRPITIHDMSAVVTAVLLTMNLPPTAPWWMAMVGSIFAIAIVKQTFGGIGQNFVNPALAARAILMACWPVAMTNEAFVNPTFWGSVNAVTGPTPLALIKTGTMDALPGLWNMIWGNIGGCIGETSAIALLLGALYLLIRRVIDWRIPIPFVGTVLVLTYLMGGLDTTRTLYSFFGGGLFLGAFFMATDYVTSPVTSKGKIIMGVGCGLITVIIRLLGGYPEGVSYAILLMNVASPLIERYTRPAVFGEVRKHA